MRFAAIRPILRFLAAKKAGQQVVILPLYGPEISNPTQLVKYLAIERGVCKLTVWRWLKRFRQSGIEGLRNRVRRDRGIPRELSRAVRQ